MNASSTPSNECFTLIVALKYVMAGDAESVALLQKLEDRFRAIDWNDPQVTILTKAAHAGLPDSAELGANPVEKLRNLLYYQLKERAADNEALQAFMPKLAAICERETAALQLVFDLARMARSMQGRLEKLGEDISFYRIEMPAILKDSLTPADPV